MHYDVTQSWVNALYKALSELDEESSMFDLLLTNAALDAFGAAKQPDSPILLSEVHHSLNNGTRSFEVVI